MTRGAQEFVGAVTFESVTGRTARSDIFAAGDALAHIRLAREADAIVVAPATADFVARAVHGRADDLLAAILLAAQCPVLLAPAMNDDMWSHPQTQFNVAHARALGYAVLDPEAGPLAFGEGAGPGRLPDPESIALHVGRILAPDSPLGATKVVVTAGATREPIDPVRFMSNYSSGKMGVALARAAWLRGADVTLIAGALDVAAPKEFAVVRATTTADMAHEVAYALPGAHVLIMAAAPADFHAEHPESYKIKKSDADQTIELVPTLDILASTAGYRKAGSVIVGFALETDDLVDNARHKLEQKGLDMVVANRAGHAEEGFGSDTNRVTLVTANSVEELPLMPKSEVADEILNRVEELLRGR